MTDSNQFEVFMRNYQDMVYSTAVRLLGNETDAQDISQVVFLKAYENFTGIAQSPTAGGWLKTVATNLCLNHLSRYRARWRFFSEMRSEESDEDFSEHLPGPDTMEQGLAEGDYRHLLETAIKKLPAAQRVPLVLFHFENQGYEEISRKLRVSLSKVKTDIHRGRLALKRHLKPGLKGEERWEESADSGKSSAAPPRKREPEPPSLSFFTRQATPIIRHATGI
jgi:RNA polymerase sigma-70 factor, ECF subfamily